MEFPKGTRTVDNKIFMKFFNLHRSIMSRCYDKNNKNYHRYGGKGIIVSKEWHNLDNFFKTIEEVENFDLDKIMNNELELDKDIKGGKIYSVDNCIFVDKVTNCSFRCNNKEFVAISPEYKISYHRNREKFARDNNLSARSIWNKLQYGGFYKGWQFFYKEGFNIENIKKKQIYIIVLPNGERIEYDGKISDFARKYNLSEPNISMVISGKQTNHKGFQFWRIEDFSIDKVKDLSVKQYKGINSDGEEFIFSNLTKFAKEHSLSQSNISICLKDKNKLHKGWKFERV